MINQLSYLFLELKKFAEPLNKYLYSREGIEFLCFKYGWNLPLDDAVFTKLDQSLQIKTILLDFFEEASLLEAKMDAELRARFKAANPPQVASTFTDEPTAERAISRLLDSRQTDIDHWLTGNVQRLALEGRDSSILGRSMDAQGNVTHVDGLRAVLVRDARMPEGYRILTAFPQA